MVQNTIKKEKVINFFTDFKKVISDMKFAKNEVAFFDMIFYSTLTSTYELSYNQKNLYKEEDLKGLRHDFYVNHLMKKKRKEFAEGKVGSYALNIEVDIVDYGNDDFIDKWEVDNNIPIDKDTVFYHEIKEVFQQKSDINTSYSDERKRTFFSKTPFPSIKVIEGYYFADQDNYFVFVLSIGFKKRLEGDKNVQIAEEFRKKDSGTDLLIHQYFTENIIRNLIERKEADLIRETRSTAFMHSLKTFNLQLSKSLFSDEKSIERLKGKVLSNYIAINIEWFEASEKGDMPAADLENLFDFGLFLENIFIQVYLLVFKDAQSLLAESRGKMVEELKNIGGLTAALKAANQSLDFNTIKKYFLGEQETNELMEIIKKTDTIFFYNEVKKSDAKRKIFLSFSKKRTFFIELYLQFFEFFHNAIKHADHAIHYYYANDADGNNYILFSSKKISSLAVSGGIFVDNIITFHEANKDKVMHAQENGHYGLLLLTKFFSRNGCEFSRFKLGQADNMNFIRCIKFGSQTELFSIKTEI
jgi:hypothetical protein